jgi:hypothetical protein
MSEIVIAFITGVISPVTIILLKNKLTKKKKSDMVTETLKVSELITNKIEDIRDSYHADRVWLTQFHNGGNFYPTGKSMAKFSIIYESVGPHTNSIQMNLQNIPVNLFSKSINYLYQNNIIAIPDYLDETIATYGLKYLAEECKTKSTYQFAIKSLDGKFIGTLGVEFTKKKVHLSPETIKELHIQVSSLGGVLMSHLQQK